MTHVQTAKIFMNGQSQTAHLPKEFRFNTEKVYTRRNHHGEVVLSEQPRTWNEFFAKHGNADVFEEFMQDCELDQPKERDLF